MCRGSALADDFAAAHAGAGAEIDDRVGRPHRVFVMLDDDDRVAHVAQLRERVEQLLIVARVQADRRFVEDVEHADQAAADLPGQPNSLRFAARERRGGAIERQIFEPDVDQKPEPAANFLEHFGGDRLSGRIEIQGRRRTRPRRRPTDCKLPAASAPAGRRISAGRW